MTLIYFPLFASVCQLLPLRPLSSHSTMNLDHLALSQEYPLDDLCNEVIDRWKTSRADVIKKREQVRGKFCSPLN